MQVKPRGKNALSKLEEGDCKSVSQNGVVANLKKASRKKTHQTKNRQNIVFTERRRDHQSPGDTSALKLAISYNAA